MVVCWLMVVLLLVLLGCACWSVVLLLYVLRVLVWLRVFLFRGSPVSHTPKKEKGL
jgi:hypothetical protein